MPIMSIEALTQTLEGEEQYYNLFSFVCVRILSCANEVSNHKISSAGEHCKEAKESQSTRTNSMMPIFPEVHRTAQLQPTLPAAPKGPRNFLLSN